MDDIAIITLPTARWAEYRDLRLTALRTDPTAFGETLDRALAHPETLWRDRLTGTERFLRFAERAGVLVGLAGAIPGDEAGVALIVSVFVHPSARGLGVGRRLVSALLTELTERGDHDVARLAVTSTNEQAIGLYRALGFAVVGVEREAIEHAGRTYDELIMERRLQAG